MSAAILIPVLQFCAPPSSIFCYHFCLLLSSLPILKSCLPPSSPPQFLLSVLSAAILIPHSQVLLAPTSIPAIRSACRYPHYPFSSSACLPPQLLISVLPAAILITQSLVLPASLLNSCYQLCLPLSSFPIPKFCMPPSSSTPAISSACRYPHYPFSSPACLLLNSCYQF
jgi:hypothetical protein